MKKSPEELIKFGEHQFENQSKVLPLWQTLAEHFYPERSDFTITRNVGDEISDNLMDSFPLLVRRDLGNSLSAMLRDGDWFEMQAMGNTADHMGKAWLQWSSQRLRTMMSDRQSNFVRATKEADHDYITFGQPVISVERNRKANGLLYQCWHLRDCAWWDDENGQVCGVVRKRQMTATDMVSYFGEDNVHAKVREAIKQNKPFKEFKVYHYHMPSQFYDDEMTDKFPYATGYVDVANHHEMEFIGARHKRYVIPRFQTIAGSPYAYSPATIVALPNARVLQAMSHTLIEAAESYTRPPMIATSKVITGGIDLSPHGITWADKEYDERLGAALRPVPQDRGGYPIGADQRENVVEVLRSAFYANKLSLPDITHEMTAYEVQERMKQFRRENLPLFAPIEAEYSGALCELSFDIALDNGFLGSLHSIPQSLSQSSVEFKFSSPLSDFQEEQKAQKFQMVSKLLAEASQVDQAVAINFNVDHAFRDAVEGLGTPQEWLHSEEHVAEGRQMAAVRELAADGTLPAAGGAEE
jgi:hypothetical protein